MFFSDQAEDGGIFIYDLLQSPVVPVASARLPRGQDADHRSRSSRLVDVGGGGGGGKGGAPAYSVAFNPRQRDLLATGDGKGRVIIWRMSWRLANKRPGEDTGLERLFKGSVGDVSAVVEDRCLRMRGVDFSDWWEDFRQVPSPEDIPSAS